VDCEKFDRVVLDLLYDELDELTRAAAMRHVEHCARCGPIANGLRATRAVGVIPLVEPPPDLELKILQAERRVRARLPWRQRFGRAVSIVAGYAMRPQLSMAALLLLMIGSSLLVLRSHPSDRDQGRVKESGVPELEGEAPAAVAGPGRAPPVPAASAFAAPPAREDRRALAAAGETSPAAATHAPAAEPAKAKRGLASDTTDGYEQAMAAYRDSRFAEAERGFDEVAAAHGGNAASAALMAAQARRQASGCASAVPRFEDVASRFAGSSAGHEATWQASECYRELGQRARAEQGYRVLAQVPGYDERARGALGAMGGEPLAMARRQAAAKPRAAAAAPPPSQPAARAGSQQNSAQ
jgi:hypothetical protein